MFQTTLFRNALQPTHMRKINESFALFNADGGVSGFIPPNSTIAMENFDPHIVLSSELVGNGDNSRSLFRSETKMFTLQMNNLMPAELTPLPGTRIVRATSDPIYLSSQNLWAFGCRIDNSRFAICTSKTGVSVDVAFQSFDFAIDCFVQFKQRLLFPIKVLHPNAPKNNDTVVYSRMFSTNLSDLIGLTEECTDTNGICGLAADPLYEDVVLGAEITGGFVFGYDRQLMLTTDGLTASSVMQFTRIHVGALIRTHRNRDIAVFAAEPRAEDAFVGYCQFPPCVMRTDGTRDSTRVVQRDRQPPLPRTTFADCGSSTRPALSIGCSCSSSASCLNNATCFNNVCYGLSLRTDFRHTFNFREMFANGFGFFGDSEENLHISGGAPGVKYATSKRHFVRLDDQALFVAEERGLISESKLSTTFTPALMQEFQRSDGATIFCAGAMSRSMYGNAYAFDVASAPNDTFALQQTQSFPQPVNSMLSMGDWIVYSTGSMYSSSGTIFAFDSKQLPAPSLVRTASKGEVYLQRITESGPAGHSPAYVFQKSGFRLTIRGTDTAAIAFAATPQGNYSANAYQVWLPVPRSKTKSIIITDTSRRESYDAFGGFDYVHSQTTLSSLSKLVVRATNGMVETCIMSNKQYGSARAGAAVSFSRVTSGMRMAVMYQIGSPAQLRFSVTDHASFDTICQYFRNFTAFPSDLPLSGDPLELGRLIMIKISPHNPNLLFATGSITTRNPIGTSSSNRNVYTPAAYRIELQSDLSSGVVKQLTELTAATRRSLYIENIWSDGRVAFREFRTNQLIVYGGMSGDVVRPYPSEFSLGKRGAQNDANSDANSVPIPYYSLPRDVSMTFVLDLVDDEKLKTDYVLMNNQRATVVNRLPSSASFLIGTRLYTAFGGREGDFSNGTAGIHSVDVNAGNPRLEVAVEGVTDMTSCNGLLYYYVAPHWPRNVELRVLVPDSGGQTSVMRTGLHAASPLSCVQHYVTYGFVKDTAWIRAAIDVNVPPVTLPPTPSPTPAPPTPVPPTPPPTSKPPTPRPTPFPSRSPAAPGSTTTAGGSDTTKNIYDTISSPPTTSSAPGSTLIVGQTTDNPTDGDSGADECENCLLYGVAGGACCCGVIVTLCIVLAVKKRHKKHKKETKNSMFGSDRNVSPMQDIPIVPPVPFSASRAEAASTPIATQVQQEYGQIQLPTNNYQAANFGRSTPMNYTGLPPEQ